MVAAKHGPTPRPGPMSPADDAIERLETQMAVLVRRIEHVSRRSSVHRDMDRAGYLLARMLADHGPATVNELAGRLGLDASTVTRQVNALHTAGFVQRREHPDDRRASVVRLLARGRREMERVRQARQARFADIVTGWTAEDVDTLAALLGRLNDAVASRTAGLDASA